jgi:hypothetical protein
MNRLSCTCVLLICVSPSALVFAQQADDTQGTQPTDNADVIAEVQQLKAEVERLSQEVARLDDEVNRLRTAPSSTVSTVRSKPKAQTASAKTDAPVVATAAPSPTPQPEEPTPITTLVFRDGHRIETRNYAIIGDSIWVYSEQDSKKYRVADLDVDATKKLNSDHGVLFQLPPTR